MPLTAHARLLDCTLKSKNNRVSDALETLAREDLLEIGVKFPMRVRLRPYLLIGCGTEPTRGRIRQRYLLRRAVNLPQAAAGSGVISESRRLRSPRAATSKSYCACKFIHTCGSIPKSRPSRSAVSADIAR